MHFPPSRRNTRRRDGENVSEQSLFLERHGWQSFGNAQSVGAVSDMLENEASFGNGNSLGNGSPCEAQI